MYLSESEEMFLSRLERNIKRVYITYIVVGLTLCASIYCIYIAVVLGRNAFLNPGIVILTFGFCFLFIVHAYRKMFIIVSKLKASIKELEDKNKLLYH
jgi:hypothetical protein